MFRQPDKHDDKQFSRRPLGRPGKGRQRGSPHPELWSTSEMGAPSSVISLSVRLPSKPASHIANRFSRSRSREAVDHRDDENSALGTESSCEVWCPHVDDQVTMRPLDRCSIPGQEPVACD